MGERPLRMRKVAGSSPVCSTIQKGYEMNNWLVIGIKENWITTLSQPIPIWGLKHRYFQTFQYIQVGDILWLYATSPVKGIIGIGEVKEKYIDYKTQIWPQEIDENHVIWPLRFRMHILKMLPLGQWEQYCIKINDFPINWQQGFQQIPNKYITELFKRSEEIFGTVIYEGASITQIPEITSETLKEEMTVVPSQTDIITHSLSLHKELQNYLAEIGKLQSYYSEIEYSLELPYERKSLDVVWKREIGGVPTFAFEIELSNMIEKAIERLKFAFKKWNSRPRIIVPEDSLIKLNNIISNSERDFSSQLRNYKPEQIKDLITKKRELKNLEQELGLY